MGNRNKLTRFHGLKIPKHLSVFDSIINTYVPARTFLSSEQSAPHPTWLKHLLTIFEKKAEPDMNRVVFAYPEAAHLSPLFMLNTLCHNIAS